jgi:Skp family chaperone for outer membrane proteins
MRKILASALVLPLLIGAINAKAEENSVINGLTKAQEISDKIEAKADKEAWEAKKEQMKKKYKEKKKALKEEYKAEKKAAEEKHKAHKEKAKSDWENSVKSFVRRIGGLWPVITNIAYSIS